MSRPTSPSPPELGTKSGEQNTEGETRRKIQWFPVFDLPVDRHDQTARALAGGVSHNNFYTVMPFVADLQTWVRKQQSRRLKAASKAAPETARGRIGTHKSSAFTPVVPKSRFSLPFPHFSASAAMEKLTWSLPSARLSEPRNLNELSAPADPSEALFRPVGASSPHTFSGNSFLQMFSGPSSETPLLHPVPFPAVPLLDEPVYVAPKEVQRTKKPSSSEHFQQVAHSSRPFPCRPSPIPAWGRRCQRRRSRSSSSVSWGVLPSPSTLPGPRLSTQLLSWSRSRWEVSFPQPTPLTTRRPSARRQTSSLPLAPRRRSPVRTSFPAWCRPSVSRGFPSVKLGRPSR